MILRVAIESEHQRVRVQVVVGSKLSFNARRRNVAPKFDDHSLRHIRDVYETIGFHRIESVQSGSHDSQFRLNLD
jgi:hypothetical protein